MLKQWFLPGDWELPVVRVTTDLPPASGDRVRDGSRRPDLIRVAEAIESARVEMQTAPAAAARRPRLVDLDEARGLSPHAARRDRGFISGPAT